MSIQIHFEREPSWRAINMILDDPPCCFCGYNGPRYYQPTSHQEGCYWRQRMERAKETVDASMVEEPEDNSAVAAELEQWNDLYDEQESDRNIITGEWELES